jgi:hypothetical protein
LNAHSYILLIRIVRIIRVMVRVKSTTDASNKGKGRCPHAAGAESDGIFKRLVQNMLSERVLRVHRMPVDLSVSCVFLSQT